MAGVTGNDLRDIISGKGTNGVSWPWGGSPSSSDGIGITGGIGGGNFTDSAYPANQGLASRGTQEPWNPQNKPVAGWIANALNYAWANGWRGTVTSGQRTPSEQMSAATRYGLNHYPNGPLASNHVGNSTYPNGAVDVSNPSGLAAALKGYSGKRLVWGGPVMGDQVHFSANGH